MEKVFKSLFPQIDIPEISVNEFIFNNIKKENLKKKILIEYETERSLNFEELILYSNYFASGLQNIGMKKNDILCIMLPNIIEFPIIYFGTLINGGIVTMMNPLYTNREITYQIKDCKAKYLVIEETLKEKIINSLSESNIEMLIILGKNEKDWNFNNKISYSELINQGKLLFSKFSKNNEINVKEDIAILPYSSGTTGLPKGVMLTHYNIVSNLCQLKEFKWHDLNENNVFLLFLPFFHTFGLQTLSSALYLNNSIVLLKKYELKSFLESIQKYKVTRTSIVPSIVLQLINDPIVRNYDLSSLKEINSGAAPLSIEIENKFKKEFNNFIRQGYGLTETTLVVNLNGTKKEHNKLGSVGVLLPNIECKIIDSNGNSLGINEPGELLYKGPNIMKGYYNKPEITENSIDKDGWFHTGDVGYVDEDGYFYIIDRIKDLIKYKGMQVSPTELESLLLTHPDILDVAVIGKKKIETGEIPKAFIILKKDKKITEEEIIQWVKERISPHKQIREVEFVEKIPKSATGKILRNFLKENN